MNNGKKVWVLAAALALALAAPAAAADKKADGKAAAKPAGVKLVEQGWTKRCDNLPKGGKRCEIFQRLGVEGSKQRVAEFALSFPAPDKNFQKGEALGGIILPLGILVDIPSAMKIDDKNIVPFKVHYCTRQGCISYVKITAGTLAALKATQKVTLGFKTAEGKTVNLGLDMKGFTAALKDLPPAP